MIIVYACPWLGPPSGGVAIHYVLPVLWTTSFVRIMGHMHGCRCNPGTASQRDDAGWTWSGRGPYDVGYCKPWAQSAVCDKLSLVSPETSSSNLANIK